MKSIEEKVYETILPYADEMNLEIYDVIYSKQGKDMYLSIYIENKEGITINDCENFSRKIDPILDEKIDIKEQYLLEVTSCGLERHIRTEEQMKRYLSTEVSLSLYKAIEGKKKISGILYKYNKDILVILCDNKEYSIERNNIGQIRTVYNFEEMKGECI